MTNLPFLLQTTNFLSQSICTNIPPHQSREARTSLHYLCNTDCKMKQKLTTANLGPWGGWRGGAGSGWGSSTMGHLEVHGELVGAESFSSSTAKRGGWNWGSNFSWNTHTHTNNSWTRRKSMDTSEIHKTPEKATVLGAFRSALGSGQNCFVGYRLI